MKVRLGYVSNSSSSSFMVMGIVIDPSEEHDRRLVGLSDDAKGFKAGAFLDRIFPKLDVVSGIYDYEDRYVIGYDAYRMRDDETLRQFRERIAAELESRVPGITAMHPVAWHQDGGFVG